MKHLKLTHPNFNLLLERFKLRKQNEGKSSTSITNLYNNTKEFLYYSQEQGVQDLNNINQDFITNYFKYLQTRPNQRKAGGLSNASLDKHREAVLRFFEFFKEVDTGQSGFQIPIHKKRSEYIPKAVLTKAEVAELFASQLPDIDGVQNIAILSLLYGCGLRKSELYRLNVTDINLFSDTIRIRKTKNAHQRDVPMSPNVKSNIENYLYTAREYLVPDSKTEMAFLVSKTGKRMSPYTIQYKVNKIAEHSTSNKRITAHLLRHAIATHLLDDFTIEDIAFFLGHKNIDSSQIYIHINQHKKQA